VREAATYESKKEEARIKKEEIKKERIMNGRGLGFAARAKRFPVVRPNGCPRAEKLLAKHLGFAGFRQASEQTDDAQRKLLRPFLEVVIVFHHFNFLIHPSYFLL
jgi:hypothetical protein